MIKTNGYYLAYPKFYEEIIFGDHKLNGFHHNGYYFKSDGKFFIASKTTKNIKDVFLKSDFLEDQLNIYRIEENKLILVFDYGEEWQHEQTLSIFNENTLCNVEKILRFVPF
jgi:hypothetical protein